MAKTIRDGSWITDKQEVTDYFFVADIARRDFAKRFERGKLISCRNVLPTFRPDLPLRCGLDGRTNACQA
jgi:hypothetical protein